MKKIIIIAFLFLINPLHIFAAGLTDADLLKEKLAKFQQIRADFSQVVSNQQGEIINESEGSLTISRPGKFRWEVITPEEELIISDGQIMWMYSPFIEQVSLVNLSDAIAGTPFILLSGASDEQWHDYKISRDNKRFTIAGIDPQMQQNSFIFEFDGNDHISRFTVIEEQGQRSEFKLTYKPITEKIEDNYFTFEIPKGVEIDDQR